MGPYRYPIIAYNPLLVGPWAPIYGLCGDLVSTLGSKVKGLLYLSDELLMNGEIRFTIRNILDSKRLLAQLLNKLILPISIDL